MTAPLTSTERSRRSRERKQRARIYRQAKGPPAADDGTSPWLPDRGDKWASGQLRRETDLRLARQAAEGAIAHLPVRDQCVLVASLLADLQARRRYG